MASKVLMQNPSSMSNVMQAVGMVPRSRSFRQACSPKKMQPAVPSSIITEAFPSAKVARACSGLDQLWREIQGCNNWENLVNPLHPLLRQEIIRYGEFIIACYEAFDLNPSSNQYLTCKYGKQRMFEEVGMQNSGYEVTKYIYATPSININVPIENGVSNCGRWIGYVAVSSEKDIVSRLGRRDVLVTFRGTATSLEWISNFMSSLTPARLDPHNPRQDVKVESGFLSLYTSDESDRTRFGLGSCREQLLSEISRLLNRYKDEQVSISLAGHSMGSALALLLAYDIAELGLHRMNRNWDVPITVFSFGGPRVGNAGFKERCEELGVKSLRIVNVNDPITKLPGVFLNENHRVLGGRWSRSCYAHVGVELLLDFFDMQNPSCVHDLEAYISLLKCPIPKNEVDFVSRAKDLISFAENFSLPLSNPARKKISLLQSQIIEYLTGENILGLMTSLALYIFL